MAKVQVIQSIVAKNGKYIVLPVWVEGDAGYGNLAHPDPYVLTSEQQYPIATKFVDGEKVFHYGYMYSDTGPQSRSGLGVVNLSEMVSHTTDAVVHAVGETEIVIEDALSTVNQWAGGTFMNYIAPYYTAHRILSNIVSDGEHSTLTLERGLIVAMTASLAGNETYANQYKKVGACWVTGDWDAPVVGVAIVATVASRYAWLQTWGPCIIAGGDEAPGSEAGYWAADFNIDGTLVDHNGGRGRLAGYVLNNVGTSYTASHFIYLMLAS